MDRDVRWFAMPIGMQISNIGSEVNRALRWKNKNEKDKMMDFYKKSIELIRLTERDPKNRHRIRELHFCEEELADYYGTTEATLLM